jgi:hypothetical protein
MAALALDMGYETEAARVMLVYWVIQSLADWRQLLSTFRIVFHDDLTWRLDPGTATFRRREASLRKYGAKPNYASRDAALRQEAATAAAVSAKGSARNNAHRAFHFDETSTCAAALLRL